MTTSVAPVTKQRIESIDIVRGLIMLIMALDHTRDFFGATTGEPTNMATTTVVLFFTRWVTHFCAPNFVFLSGVSAYLAGTRRSKGELASFLIKRGCWLILIELVVMSFALTLNPLYNVLVLQVIFVIGFSMVLLGLLVRAPLAVIGIIGAIIFFGHNILDFVTLPENGAGSVLMKLFFTARGTVLPLSANRIILDLYAVIPWTGVMFLGYCFGSIYRPSFDARRRKMILRLSGLLLVIIFIVLRYFNFYGDPAPWSVQRNFAHSILSFLNTVKYPPSLLYLCMTIGPALIALSLIEGVKNKFFSILIIYGNVPFFYYILHFYLIRTFNIIAFFATGHTTKQIITPGQIFLFQPPGFGFSLPVVYLVWLLVIATLYLPCHWYSKYKRTHRQWWLSYL
jgi:uncharacterized membrane protein